MRRTERLVGPMKRRDFILLVGGAAAWPYAARAQQPGMPVIGFLSARSAKESANLVDAFRKGLAEYGVIEDQNVTVDYKWAHSRYDRLPAGAADFAAAVGFLRFGFRTRL